MGSAHETVAVALQTRLATITAGVSGAVYTPGAVERVSFFPDELPLDASITTPTYLIGPGRETRRITNQGCFVECDLEFLIVVAKPFKEPTENPHVADPVRWQAAADMVADVLAKIHEDTTLGGAAVDVFGIEVDFDRSSPVWAEAEIRLQVRYRYARAGGR